MIVGKSLFPAGQGFSSIASMQARMEQLQEQLATGSRISTLSDLGSERVLDMTIRNRTSRIEAFQSNIQIVDLRMSFMSNAVERLDVIESDSRAAVSSGGSGANGLNMVTAQSLAETRLDEVLTLLNSEVNGRYLFAGSFSDAPPVESMSAILDGVGGKDGFRTVVGERKLADAGADGRGRLTTLTAPAVSTSSLGGAVDGTELLSSAEIGFANTETLTLSGGGFAPVNITFTNAGGATTGPTLDINATDVNALVVEINAQAGATIAAVSGGEVVITGQDLVSSIATGGTATTGLVNSSPSLSATLPATSTSALGGLIDGTELLDSAEVGFANTETFTLSGGGFAPVSISFTNVGGATTGAALDITATDINAFVTEINAQAGATIAAISGGEVVITGQDLLNPITAGGTAPSGMTNSSPGTDILTLSEDGAHPFGFKLGSLSSTSGAVSLTQASGTPASLSVQFTGAPLAGETITIGFTLPDGTAHAIEFNATTDTPTRVNEFQVGATPQDTAANFSQAINDELLRIKTTVLEAASVYEASNNFFNGQGETILRVDGPPFETATALIAATPTNTVSWYVGEDASGPARSTVQTRIDESTSVNYGVQANEYGLVELVRSLSALSVEDYPGGDPSAEERFSAMAQTQRQRLSEANNSKSGSIELITLELGIATATTGNVKERHTAYRVQLETMLAEIEQAPIEEVAMELLSLQTRLQASFQTTSMIAQLTLVNYIR